VVKAHDFSELVRRARDADLYGGEGVGREFDYLCRLIGGEFNLFHYQFVGVANMIDMSKYGEPLFFYQGYGEISFASKRMENCIFEVGQFKDGTIRLCCSFTYFFPLALNGRLNVSGQTKEGKKLLMSGDAIRERAVHTINMQQQQGFDLQFLLFGDTRLQVGEPLWTKSNEVHFGMTNFRFIGNEVGEVDGQLRLNTLLFSLQSRVIRIRQSNKYEEDIDVLAANEGIGVTGEAIVAATSHKELVVAMEIVANVCSLLSLARGTLLSLPYFHLIYEGRIIYTEHNVPKKGYYSGAFPIIDPMNGHDTKRL
jgi:hypothetical protein